jgi:phosphotransferase system HPr (HPr) family protein
VQLTKTFRSSIALKSGQKIADLRSIISIISLCATMGTALDVEITGEDEQEATRALERVFATQSQAGPASDAVAPTAPRRS